MEFVSAIFQPAIDFVVKSGGRQLGYLFCYKTHIEELKAKAMSLKDRRDRVQHKVDAAERNAEEIEADVQHWLEEVDKMNQAHEEFQEDEGHGKARCSNFSFPNLWLRHKFGRKATKMKQQIDELLEDAKVDGSVSHHPGPALSMDAALSNIGYESFESRNKIIEDILKALENSNVGRIGIHGLGGVGKTTLVKEVAKRAQEKKLFNVVVMANITSNPDVKKIQGQIADMLGLRLEEGSEIGRAGHIRGRLKKENTLVILDDLWDGIDLSKLGIPSDDDDNFSERIAKDRPDFDGSLSQETAKDRPDFDDSLSQGSAKEIPSLDGSVNHVAAKDVPEFDDNMSKKVTSLGDNKRCKILLTSRNREVLSNQMDVDKNSIFPVVVLDEKEAETLFEKMAGLDKASNLSTLAASVAKKCAGLPMAIVTIGRALRNKNSTVWKDALQQLEGREFTEMQESVEFSVKLSYDHLENEELKSTFLLCARMGNDPLIMDLLKYCIGLRVFQGVNMMREARNRVDALVTRLKNLSLLLDSYSGGRFTMHDMVRNVALSIASKEQRVFTVRNGKLDEWPDNDELERYTAISLHYCDFIDELPEEMNCPRLKVLHIDNSDPFLRIPDNFFEGMKNLRVLILTGIRFSKLPYSIKFLTNLRMLCLEQCKIDGNLPIIGELKNLRILSLAGAEFENLPSELGKLGKLQLLDISNCSKLRVIPPHVISRLNSLEELYMRNNSIQWEAEGQTEQSQNASLADLSHLHQLTTLDMYIPNVAVLPRNLFFDELDSYKIVIGDFKTLSVGDFKIPDKYEASRVLALQLKEGIKIHSQKGIKVLFRKVERLLLGELNGVQNVFLELNLEGFPCLKHLSIINNFDIQCIINTTEIFSPQEVFPNLESLCLYRLEKIEKICSSLVTDSSFNNLKTINIRICGQLKNLFSCFMVGLLTNLQTIEVSECDSLEEIVVWERQGNTDHVMKDKEIVFPQLRSLVLRSLPAFTGFYTSDKMLSISQPVENQVSSSRLSEITAEEESGVTSLLSEKVKLPKLENLELSSINIHKIWIDQPLLSFSFDKLIKLKVKDCGGLRYLVSFSMARSLPNLKSLSVSECEMMEEIFVPKRIMTDDAKVGVFSKLEEIQLTSMENLKTIWHTQVNLGSLNNLTILKCQKLVTVFPSHMAGRFECLCDLKVVDCESIEVIFDLKDTQPTNGGNGTKESKLRVVYMEVLPNLKYIWNGDPEGIINFKNLQNVLLRKCPKLRNIFPVSVAKGLENLKFLSVYYCDEMQQIVAREEGLDLETSSITFVLPQVTSLALVEVPSFRSFYEGEHNLQWPALKDLSLLNWGFSTDTTNPEAEPILLAEKVISNLDRMFIGPKETKWLRHRISKCGMHSLKLLHLGSLKSIEILYWFLHRIPSLKRLVLEFCFLEELLADGILTEHENIGTVVQLKDLTLRYLPALRNIGFERDPILLQRVERLTLWRCSRLMNLSPPSVSFTHLTYLEVSECDGLRNLLSSSTAKSLVRLTTMKVIKCKLMRHIVAKGRYEQETDEIIFSKLATLVLVSLKSFTSFCSSKNCDLRFPSLEKLTVRECPKMKIFCEGDAMVPHLRQVHVVEGEEEERWYWEGDLKATIQKIFTDRVSLEYAEHLEFNNFYPELKQVWNCTVPLPDNCFGNLKTLVIMNCEFLNAIPSNLLPYLKNLEELQVQNSSKVEEIFDINERNFTASKGTAFRLRKLTLAALGYLKHVFIKNAQGILTFQYLKEVHVSNCGRLKSLIPASVAKNLVKLVKLHISNCKALVEVVGKNDAAAEGAAETFLFPCLTSLILSDLPEIKGFYPGRHILECPMLKNLNVYHCGKLQIFTSQYLSYQEVHPKDQIGISIDGQPLLLDDQKVISNLEALSLNEKEAMMLWHGEFPRNLLHKLTSLVLQCFHNVNGADIFPYGFLQKVPNIVKLTVLHSGFMEIFPSEGLEVEYMPAQLRELFLDSLDKLNSIGPLSEDLEILDVRQCPCLTKLVEPAVSFFKLKVLTIFRCDGLVYLFTSSTAKSLVQLEELIIQRCKSIKEIVAEEGDVSTTCEIIFRQLKLLNLDDLISLASFYTGKFTLKFPSLDTVIITACPQVKIFSQGAIIAPVLEVVHASKFSLVDNKIDLCWNGDLNTTVKLYQEKVTEFARNISHLNLSDHPELKVIWHGEVLIPDGCFRNLRTLILSRLNLSEVIPSNLLPFLSNLTQLEVRNCGSVKVIYDVRDVIVDAKKINMGSTLKKLILEKLSNLDHIWNKDPEGIFNLQSLQQVHVDKCKRLRSLFPTSVAKDLLKLENLEVKNCERLEEIVANDETAAEGATKEFVFPRVTSLTLWELPQLNYFYPGLHKLEWPKLKQLQVRHCDKLKVFASEFQCYGEEYREDRVDIPIDHQVALVSVTKVIPDLELLTIGHKEANSLSHCINNCHMNRLKTLRLEFLKRMEFPYGFLHRTPNLEALKLLGCHFQELLPNPKLAVHEKMGTVVQLKDLSLMQMHSLHDIGFEKDPTLFGWMQRLILDNCPRLIILAPGSISFTYLTYLEVRACHELINLMESSTAKSLVQLTILKVNECKVMEEIVAKEGKGDEREADIVFCGLTTLELVSLQNLTSFCSSECCAFMFPSLEKLIVRECPKMKLFSGGVTDTPKLLKVHIVEGEEDGKWYWEGNLNATIQKMFTDMISFEYPKHLKVSDYPQLEQLWHGEVPLPKNCFQFLTTLVMENCEFLSNVIPCNLLPYLKSLEHLQVRSCSSVEKIFDINDKKLTKTEGIPFRLKTLTLYKLPNLKNVWSKKKDPLGFLCFQNLEEVSVNNCKGLKFLFPTSVGKNLVKLKELDIRNCEMMEEIVGKDREAAEGAFFKFKFPCLTTLTLYWLVELKCFYPGRHNLKCPMLNSLDVFHCGKLGIFTTEFQSYGEGKPEDQVGSSINQQSLFSVQKVIPKVEKLSLNPKDTMMLWHGQFQENLLHKIKEIALQCFHSVNEGDILPYGFLKKVPNIETLQVSCSGLKEIFPSERLEADDIRILAQLKALSLLVLPRLKSIGLEHSWLEPLCDNLQGLKVDSCYRLVSLVQSAVSFFNLKELIIVDCHGLQYLFTSSTAKSLVRLEEMSIEESESIKEIVAKEEDESTSDEIIFGKLKTLSLKSLLSLLSFYTGNSPLKFPSLETVIINECPRMKIFSHGIINAPMLEAIQVSSKTNDLRWFTDLNTTVVKMFNEKVSLEYLVHLKLLDYPELEKEWHGDVPLQKTLFSNLKTLVVENCEFLSNVIPSHLFPYLKKLEELQVKNCSQVEVIFDVNDMKMTTIGKVSFSLKKLTLDQLPNLKHVCNKDPEGIVDFKNLQEVQVTKCKQLKTLFVTSLAKNLGKLKTLTIKTCGAMVEIVGKDEAAIEGITTEFVFPCLTSLVLSEIQELKFFYAGRHSLLCPKLKNLRVYHCGKLEMFTLESRSYQEAHSEDHQVGISNDAQPLFLVQKVIPKLEELSLNEKEAMMLWDGKFQENLLHNVKHLQLYCFHHVNEADILPFGFLHKVPNIETLVVACCDFKEIFPSQSFEDDHIRTLAKLRRLSLENLCELSSTGLEHYLLDQVRENLEMLEIWRCPCLTKIVQSAVPFSNLKELLINGCHGLEYLFTSSTAKSLVRLKNMSVEECESIKEIVAKEGDESTQDEIVFEQLLKISLNTLSSLSSFYTGYFPLKFPSLDEVIIAQCPKMKIFSQGFISAPILMGIQASLDETDLHWDGNLNSTIEKLFQEKANCNADGATRG